MSAEIESINRKLNYLLTQIKSQQQILEFTPDQIAYLKSLIRLFQDLEAEGASRDDLFFQLLYLSDIHTFLELKETLSLEYNESQYGTHYNLYSYVFDGFNRIHNSMLSNDRIGIFENINNHFQTGYIVLNCMTNVLSANNDGVALNVKSPSGVWKLELLENGPVLSIISGQQIIVKSSGEYDLLLGRERRLIPNKQFYIMYYEIINDTATLSFLLLLIDMNEKTVTINKSGVTEVESITLIDILEHLPARVNLVSLGSVSKNNNEYITFENLFISKRLDTFESSLYDAFQNEITNNNVTALYGQSAAVGMSQVYQGLSTTVRLLSGDYELQKETEKYIGASIPSQFPTFAYLQKDLFDIIGNSSGLVLTGTKQTAFGLEKYYSAARIPRSYYPYLNINNELGNVINTTFDLGTYRKNLQKSKIKQTLSDGTVRELDCWIEALTEFNQYVGFKEKGAWCRTGKGVILDAQLDGDIFSDIVDKDSVQVNGVIVSVDDPLGDVDVAPNCNLLYGYRFTAKVNSIVRFVINVGNVSAEGVVNETITYQYMKNGIVENGTGTLTKTRLVYGNGEIAAYVVEIDRLTEDVVYYNGLSWNIEFQPNPTQARYNSRDSKNIPTGYTFQQRATYSNTYTRMTDTVELSLDSDFILNGSYLFANTGNAIGIQPYNKAPAAIGYTEGIALQIPTAPFSPPVITRLGVLHPIQIDHLKTAYMRMGNDGDVPGSIQLARYNLGVSWVGESGQQDTSTIVIPYYTNKEGAAFDKKVWRKVTVRAATTDNEYYYNRATWIDDDRAELDEYSMIEFNITVSDLFIPNQTQNQLELSDSIIQLRTAVEFLEEFASYVNVLLENVDRRLTYVEDTLDQVINLITGQVSQGKTGVGLAGSIITFLGTGIGMFFPLVGLGVSLVGGLLTSVDRIQQGDIIVGSIDLVIGGLMGTLGIYKYSKKLKAKYGSREIPDNPIAVREDLSVQPGYIIINHDPPPMYTERDYNNGMFRSTNFTSTTTNGLVTNQNTSRIARQSSLWAEIDWDESAYLDKPRKVGVNLVMDEMWTSSVSARTITKSYKCEIFRLIPDGSFEIRNLTEVEHSNLLDVSDSIETYVKLQMHYSVTVQQFNTNIGIDDDIYRSLLCGCGYYNRTEQAPQRSYKQLLYKSKKRKSNSWKFKHSKYNKSRSLIKSYGPTVGIPSLFNAFNPYRQIEDSQVEVYQSCIEEYESVF